LYTLLQVKRISIGYEKGNAMSADTATQNEVMIACDPHAVPAEQRERWMAIGTQLYAAVQEVQELPAGYAFRLLASSEMLLLVAEDLAMERRCCPFLRFTLDMEPNGGPFWLRFTGGAGVKQFLRLSFESSNLLNEQVAQAVGFSIASRTELNSVETTLETISAVNEQFARAAAVRRVPEV
jgi:hypothetical protein